MRGRHQGGSLAGFIIIGALLALVLVGGLYGLNRYNAERASDQLSEQAAKDAKASKQEAEKQPTKEEERPVEEEKEETAIPTPAASGDTATKPQPATTDLPQTGPSDAIFSLVAVAALAFAATHYARSRKQTD